MIETWDDLKFWDSGEWQAIEEHLDDMEKSNRDYNPNREFLFAALDAVPFKDVRVAIYGQDPYPNSRLATGLAFSVPRSVKVLPPTLNNILREYCDDLHYPEPKNGDLTTWSDRGVLLWNVIPSCETSKPLSHREWEWEFLTKEITENLDERGIVFAFLGGVAREFVKYVVPWRSEIIETSHPAPRGADKGNNPFLGSRLFSTINDKLGQQGLEHIDWRLP